MDATAWQQGLQQAAQQLAQFEQHIARMIGQLNQFGEAFQRAFGQNQQALTVLPQRAQQASQSFQQFNTQLNQTNQAFTVINHTVQQFNTQLNNTSTVVNNTRQAMQQAHGATSAWSQALTVAGGIGIATSLQGIISSLKDLAVQTVQVGARLESLQASLNALGGGTANGARQFQFLVETAQQLGVAFEPLARGWRSLTAAASQTNLTLTDQQRLITAVATEGRRVGASNEELQRAFTALAQVASKGTLSMEELRGQLGEAIPTALAAAARGMGLTTEALIKMVETGTIRFEPFARALTRGFEEIQGASGKMADTATSAFNRMMNEFILLADAIMQSGLARYLATVAANIAEVARFTRETFFPTPHTAPIGPNLPELGVTPAQQQQVRQLDAAIAKAQDDMERARTTQRREEHARRLQALQEMREQIVEGAKAIQAEADAQAKVTAETNKTLGVRERQADFNKAFAKSLEDIAKAEQRFRDQAAFAPQRLGRPGGTPEQVQEFARNMRKELEKPLEGLSGLVDARAQGVQLTEEQRQALAKLDSQYGLLTKTIADSKDAERDRQRAAREAAAQTERAISQEISLTAQLARAKAFIARPEESAAEQAAMRARQQGAEMQRTVDEALRQFADSPALRQRAPQLQQQFQEMRQGLQAAIDTQALQAFNNAMERDVIEPLRRMAEAYGMAKEARDADKASTLEAAAANTIYAEEATKLAQAIRDSARIEAQVPELRRQAASSALAFAQSQQEQAALRTLEENLAQARIPRGVGGFPFERSREELRLQQRTQEDIRSEEGQRRAQELRQVLLAQERLNYAAGLFADFGTSVGNAWTQALTSIADHTQTVAQAFQAMARSIIQSLGQIAAQEGFKALIGLGVRMIAGAAVGGGGAGLGVGLGGESASAVGAGINPILFQHGGVVNAPTMALIGENPSTRPEVVLNRQQMQSMFSSGPGGPGTGGNVIVNNFPSREAAEEAAARQRSQGHTVIVNAVLQELSTGEASRINRAMRALQR